jgi:bacteriocin-like protein
MDMEREINLLSDNELNSVVGGRMKSPRVNEGGNGARAGGVDPRVNAAVIGGYIGVALTGTLVVLLG